MRVYIKKACHCVKKNNLDKDFEFEDEKEAKEKVQEIEKTMNTKSCKAHLFFIKPTRDGFEIDSKTNFEF